MTFDTKQGKTRLETRKQPAEWNVYLLKVHEQRCGQWKYSFPCLKSSRQRQMQELVLLYHLEAVLAHKH